MAVKHLYIDTNAYLTFYHLTSDDLEELKKLEVLIDTKEIVLHLPEQTHDEFYRNRDTKIADALKRFKEEKLNNQFPQIAKHYEEYSKMKDAIKQFDKNKTDLINKLLQDIFNNTLEADKLINSLFSKAEFYKNESRFIKIARERYDLGRPPGKNKSYGDALNWTYLLENVPEWNDLYFVSDDKDYYSEIDPAYFNSYLLEEWRQKQQSEIKYYRRISEFFKENYPQIKIASDYEKQVLIKNLTNSGSFSRTHNIIYQLNKFGEFSSEEVNSILSAYMSNPQIYWISDDTDVKDMALRIIKDNRDKIEENTIEGT